MARLGELHPSGVLWPDAERVAMSLFRGPGVCILSTVPRELDTSGAPADGYATYSGTSMASPHVAGAAALLASRTIPTPRRTFN